MPFVLAVLALALASPAPILVTPAPAAVPSAGPGDAVIRNSGSTNTTGYVIVVHPDGSADLTQNGATTRKSIGKAKAASLFASLTAAGPLDALQLGRCMRSASFGTMTTIAYAGRTSGDLGCAGDDPAAIDLSHAASSIADAVGATAPSARFRRPLSGSL